MLALMFFLAITPVGLLMRLTGKRPAVLARRESLDRAATARTSGRQHGPAVLDRSLFLLEFWRFLRVGWVSLVCCEFGEQAAPSVDSSDDDALSSPLAPSHF